jgi:hypothetical protein
LHSERAADLRWDPSDTDGNAERRFGRISDDQVEWAQWVYGKRFDGDSARGTSGQRRHVHGHGDRLCGLHDHLLSELSCASWPDVYGFSGAVLRWKPGDTDSDAEWRFGRLSDDHMDRAQWVYGQWADSDCACGASGQRRHVHGHCDRLCRVHDYLLSDVGGSYEVDVQHCNHASYL